MILLLDLRAATITLGSVFPATGTKAPSSIKAIYIVYISNIIYFFLKKKGRVKNKKKVPWLELRVVQLFEDWEKKNSFHS
jgi:hypothetical protein